MKIIKIAALLAALLASGQTLAQAANFAGWGVSAGVGSNNVFDTVEGGAVFRNAVTFVQVKANYWRPLNEKFLIGASLSSDIGNAIIYEDVSLKFQTSKDIEAAVELGYALNSKALVYGKFGYETGQFLLRFNGTGEQKKQVHGIGYGLGMRYLIRPHFYAQFELTQKEFNTIQSSIPGNFVNFQDSISHLAGSVSLGYKF